MNVQNAKITLFLDWLIRMRTMRILGTQVQVNLNLSSHQHLESSFQSLKRFKFLSERLSQSVTANQRPVTVGPRSMSNQSMKFH